MKTCFLALLLFGSIVYWRLSAPEIRAAVQPDQTSGSTGGRPSTDYEIMQRGVQRESRKLGIPNLREAASNSASETRIWVGFGTAYPRLLILKLDKGKEAAAFFTAKPGTPTTMVESSLAPPTSGWTALQTLLRDRGISSPLVLALDEKHIPDFDEETIVIEVRLGRSYSMVFFPTVSETVDGKKALDVCETLEREFNILMGCRYKG